MTIQEAIKSGRKRKLPEYLHWHEPNGGYHYSVKEVMREDWEIEQEPQEFWIWVSDFGGNSFPFKLKDSCEHAHKGQQGRAVKFREVIE